MVKHKLLSWDVGIKNLAYCIIEFDGESYKIIDWDLINLADDRKKCEYIKRGGGTCDKIAHHTFHINEDTSFETKYYCKAHVGKADYCITSPLDEIKCKKCKQSCTYIIDNSEFGWCDKHYEVELGKYKRRCVRKLDQHCNKISLVTLGNSMFEKLDAIPEMLEVDQVIIENQPALKNPNMKTVASMLFSYFVMRGIYENKGKMTADNINFAAASGKLKVNKKATNKQLKKGKNEKDVYNITKDLGIIYTKSLIGNKFKALFEKHAKKLDDLCDAFLQGIRYHYGNDIPEDIADTLRNVDVETELEKMGKGSKKKTSLVIDKSELEKLSAGNSKLKTSKKKESKNKKNTKKSVKVKKNK